MGLLLHKNRKDFLLAVGLRMAHDAFVAVNIIVKMFWIGIYFCASDVLKPCFF